MKQCWDCKEVKNLDEFAFNRSKPDGRAARCKACQSKYHRKHYLANVEQYRQNTRNHRKKNAALIASFKKKCLVCGETHPAVLEFHHRLSSDKEINLSEVGFRGWSEKRILKEVAKCDILCSNCHRKLHWAEKHCE